jgi:polysaccharide deacetylase family protein (PEP-CTERM system associated)
VSGPHPPESRSAGGDGAIRLNALTVDVEEHFQVSAFEGTVKREDWERHESRVEANTERLLDFFDSASVRATFFTLGWIAKRHPALVRKVAERGHEIACHGWSHRLVYSQQPDEFREETRRAKQTLEDVSGTVVRGYRAASFSIKYGTLWAMDVLAELGFEYDSSLYPVVHDRYGVPGAPRRPYRLRTPNRAWIVEVPPSTVRVGRFVLPVAGGGYLRLYPLALTSWAIERIHERDAMPAIVYIHPWEFDPKQPRIAAAPLARFRHYVGLDGNLDKLDRLIARFPFGRMDAVVGNFQALSEVSLA